jgi:hypothetical protein
MLGCDLILEVRASRVLTREQVLRLERAIGVVALDPHELDLLLLLDRYAERADPSWKDLLGRALAQATGGAQEFSAAA